MLPPPLPPAVLVPASKPWPETPCSIALLVQPTVVGEEVQAAPAERRSTLEAAQDGAVIDGGAGAVPLDPPPAALLAQVRPRSHGFSTLPAASALLIQPIAPCSGPPCLAACCPPAPRGAGCVRYRPTH